jgi:hypothetical protein
VPPPSRLICPVVAPRFRITDLRSSGPTENSGGDTLWLADLSEDGRTPERFRFSLARRHGVPSKGRMVSLIRKVAAQFPSDASALEQFRALEEPHPQGSERPVILLAPDRHRT